MGSTNRVIISREVLLIWAAIILLLLPAYNFYLNGIIQYRFGLGSISAISYILMAMVGIWSYFQIRKTSKIKVVTLLSILLVGTLLSYYLYPDIRLALIAPSNNPLDSQAIILFLYCVPGMIITSSIPSWEKIFDIIAKLSMILIPIAIFSYWVQLNTLGVLEINYMPISAFLVLSICVSCSYGYLHRKWYPFLLAIAGIIFIFICGSRGALICTLASLAYCVYRLFRHTGPFYKIIMVVVFALIGYWGASFIQLSESAADSGLGRGRTFIKMEDGSFFVSLDRDEINKIIDEGISDNPIGYGLFGDRQIMAEGGLPVTYCHNIFKEFLCDFGVVFGALLFLYLIYSLYKSQKEIKDCYAYEILVVAICAGLIHLLVSGSYLTDTTFWAMIGIMLNPYVRLSSST